jgi:hypothetical protein
MKAQIDEEDEKDEEYHHKYGKMKINHLRGLQKGLYQDIIDFRSQRALNSFF